MKHKDQILKLRAEGKTYDEIKEITGASKGTISYHCGDGQKEKYQKRQIKKRVKQHPYGKKLESFLRTKNKNIIKNENIKYKILIAINQKIYTFHKNRQTKELEKITFTYKDIIDKFGENPKCYLTGDNIDIYKPKTYQFDHIIPASKGGTNTLDNLGICTNEANMAKFNLSLEDFYTLCEKVLRNKKD